MAILPRNVCYYIAVATLMVSCENFFEGPNPYCLAPKAKIKPWEPPIKVLCEESQVDINDVLDIPSEGEMLSLGDLFDISLRNSPETAKSWQEARAASAFYQETLSDYYPSATFDGEVQKNKEGTLYNGLFFENRQSSVQAEINLSYIIWDSGERYAKSQESLQMLHNSNWMHNETIQTVLKTVADVYYNYLYQKALLTSVEFDLYNSEQDYKAAQEKIEFGVADMSQLLLARSRYLQRMVIVESQKGNVENSRIDLLDKLGIPCDSDFTVGDFPDDEKVQDICTDLCYCIELAKSIRPDIQALKADILAREAAVEKAKAKINPKLVATGSGGNRWYKGGFQDRGNYSVQIDLTFPIFTGFLYQNEIKRAQSELKKAKANLRNADLNMIREIKTYHNNFEVARKEMVLTLEYLEAAEKEYQVILAKYQEGTNTILDVLSAESSLSDASARHIRVKRNLYVAMINLAFATGTLSSSTPVGPSQALSKKQPIGSV